MSATPPVSGVAIPGARAQPASALSSSLLAHEGELMEAITGPANASRVSQSPFAAALSKGPTTARKTLLVLNASSWIGQAHLGAVSQTSLDLVDALRSPVADSSFSPWTQGGSEEGSVNPGGFYTGAATQAVAGDARAPSLSQLAQSPSASFLSAVGMKRAGSSSMWYPGGENDLSAGGKLRVVAAYKGSKAPLELPKGVDKVVNVDFDVPGSIDAAFDGESVDYVYIIPSYGANRVQQTNEIIQACLRHRKVRYVVLLSLLAPKISGFTGKPATSNEGEFQVQREFRDLERTVAKSGIPHTFVRVGIFHHQLFEIARRSAEWVVANNPADADVISLGLPLKTGSVAPVDVG